jgi:DNA-binding NarL/FixJ family response regulator
VAATALGGGPIRNYDMSVRTRSDNPRWINISTFVFPTNGHDAGSLVVHLFRNITQRKQNEELLNKVLTAVEKLRDRGQPDRRPQAPAVDSGAELTDREREVLSLLARGSSTDESAQALSISTSTVRNHIRNIMHKFEVHSRLEAVLYALRHGLVTLD